MKWSECGPLTRTQLVCLVGVGVAGLLSALVGLFVARVESVILGLIFVGLAVFLYPMAVDETYRKY